jgi:hypothetical protein
MPIKWPALYKKTTDRRKEWRALKTKHAAAIKASRVDFDSKLGPAIDTFEKLVSKVAAEGYGEKGTTDDLRKLSAAGGKMAIVAREYKGKLDALPNPAKNELTTFLTALLADEQMWSHAIVYGADTTKPYSNPELAGGLFQLDLTLATLVTRGKNYQAEISRARRSRQPSDQPEHASRAAFDQALADVLKAATAAQPVVKRLQGLHTNAGKNLKYLPVLKTEMAKALSGPIAKLKKELVDMQAIPKVGSIGDDVSLVLSNVRNAGPNIKTIEDGAGAL